MKRYLFVIMVAFFGTLLSANAFAIPVSSSGLEVDNYKMLPVVIKEIPEGLSNMGLTKEMVTSKVVAKLSQHDITALSNSDISHFLYIRINGTAEAFSIRVDFKRAVSFSAKKKSFTRYEASTWDSGAVGSHAATPDYITAQLDGLLDAFVSDYLKANKK